MYCVHPDPWAYRPTVPLFAQNVFGVAVVVAVVVEAVVVAVVVAIEVVAGSGIGAIGQVGGVCAVQGFVGLL